jgi:hypothetical protein
MVALLFETTERVAMVVTFDRVGVVDELFRAWDAALLNVAGRLDVVVVAGRLRAPLGSQAILLGDRERLAFGGTSTVMADETEGCAAFPAFASGAKRCGDAAIVRSECEHDVFPRCSELKQVLRLEQHSSRSSQEVRVWSDQERHDVDGQVLDE